MVAMSQPTVLMCAGASIILSMDEVVHLKTAGSTPTSARWRARERE